MKEGSAEMGITSSGPMCDVCGKYILPIDPNEKVHSFSVKGVEQGLICDSACKVRVETCGGDYKKLPEGPLRVAFAEVASELIV